MRGIVLISLLWMGCSSDVCSSFGQSCLALQVRSAPGESLSIDQLELTGLGGFPFPDGNHAFSPDSPRAPVTLPVQLAVLPPPDFTGAYQLEVRGLLGGQTMRLGYATGSVGLRQHTSVVAVLDLRDDGTPIGPVDLAGLGPADLAGLDLTEPPIQGEDLAQPCDPVLQSGCSGTDKCTLSGAAITGALVCAPSGSIPIASACDPAGDQCIKGAMCLGDGSFGFDRECRKFCDHDNLDDDCPQPAALDATHAQESHCIQLGNDSPLGLCTSPCNPVLAAGPSGCPGTSKCFFNPFVNADILGMTDCTTLMGSKTDGEVCSTEQDCAPGFYCRTITQGGQPVCRQLCRLGNDADCSSLSGYKCTQDIVSFGACCPGGTC